MINVNSQYPIEAALQSCLKSQIRSGRSCTPAERLARCTKYNNHGTKHSTGENRPVAKPKLITNAATAALRYWHFPRHFGAPQSN